VNISTDTTRCISSGNCVLTAPEIFDQDDSGLVRLLTAEPPGELRKAARDAAAHCPTAAITVRDDRE
jgi:ferredoxin